MSELMGDIHAEPKPGTALRIMVDEHRHLDEFMAMVKAKMELDKKYLSELKTLRDSWNPEWNESGVWPLISPFLTHINNEIDEREKTGTELTSRFAALPDAPPPNALTEDGLDPLEMLESVQIRHSQYEKCHKIISTSESINELEKWQREAILLNVTFEDDLANRKCQRLPQHESDYRRAVIARQTAVDWVVKWQTDTLPDVLERHQQYAEDVKSFLNVLFTCYSSIHFNLSTSCTAALSFNRAFSSSEFIAPRHDETETESSHALLWSVDYRNYIQGGKVARLIFGLGIEKTVSFVNELLNYPTKVASFTLSLLPVLSAFELEKAAAGLGTSALLETLRKEDQLWIERCMLCAFFMDEPLLPLPGDVIMQYRNGISRTKLSSLMATHLPLARREVVTLLVRLADIHIAQNPTWPREDMWRRIGTYLSHNRAAWQITGSIWRKWDIVNDRPLPEGVERVWSEHDSKSEVVWKTTGSPYYPFISKFSA